MPSPFCAWRWSDGVEVSTAGNGERYGEASLPFAQFASRLYIFHFDALPQILGSSISYRVAVGPQQGRKAFMIRTIRPLDRPDPGLERVAKANGFSLHAGVSCEGHERNKRERLCRYIARPAIAIPRLSLSATGKVVYTLKTPYRDGTTQVAFEPVDLMAHLPVRPPSGDLRSSKSAILPICHRPPGSTGPQTPRKPQGLTGQISPSVIFWISGR